jgi:3',5'-cyclic AMP phosphodiesterase CpdA
MKIVAISDSHTMLSKPQDGVPIVVPDGDVLIHAGDLTFTGVLEEVRAELKAISALPHRRKIVVPGNHDFFFDERFMDGHIFRRWRIDRPISVQELLAEFPDIDVLIDRSTMVGKYKVHGSPWQPAFYDWAFQFSAGEKGRQEAKMRWATIPLDTNILVTHTPPWGILDIVDFEHRHQGDNRAGDYLLRTRIEDLKQLRLHVFGHLHAGYGNIDLPLDGHGGEPTTFVNAALNTNSYVPLNKPIVIDL